MKKSFSKLFKNSNATRFVVIALISSMFFYSCSSDDDGAIMDSDPIDPTIEARVLPCDYFKDENRTLVHTPGAEIDYIIECVMLVDKNVTVEPGVRIAFGLDAGLHIRENGNFTAVGTAERPILLTGLEKTRGFWKGVAFKSPGVANKLDHVTIEYGGGEAIHSNVQASNITVSYDTRIAIDNSTFKNSANYGMYVYSNTREISVQNSTFTGNKVPLYSYSRVHLMDHMNMTNNYSGNDKDVIELSGGGGSNGFISSVTWRKTNVPYHLFGEITVGESGTVLNVEPGVHVLMGHGTQIRPQDASKILFLGTADDPIIFEGADPTPGSWEGFYIKNIVNSEMSHMVIKHAGGTGNEAAIVKRYGGSIIFSDIHFEDIYGCAIKDVGNGNVISTSNITTHNTNTGNVDTTLCIF